MFSRQDPSNHRGSKLRGAGFMCDLSVQILLMGGAVLLGVLFPDKSLVADERSALVRLPGLPTSPKMPLVKPPREAAWVFVAKLPWPETPELLAAFMADFETREIPHAISSVRITEPPWPRPPVDLQSPPPKRQIMVHIGLFDDATESSLTHPPGEQVQTGGSGNPLGLPGEVQGENPGNIRKLGVFELRTAHSAGNGSSGRGENPRALARGGAGSGVASGGRRDGGTGKSQEAQAILRKPTKSRQPRWRILLRRRTRSFSPPR